jgi:hypothetical protein
MDRRSINLALAGSLAAALSLLAIAAATGPGSSMLASVADKTLARAIPQNVADWTAVSFGDNYIKGDGSTRPERGRSDTR